MKADELDARGSSATAGYVNVHWYIVCVIVVVCLVVVGGLTACVYRCYRRRRLFLPPRSATSSINSALGRVLATRDRSAGDQHTTTLVTKSPSFGGATLNRSQQPPTKSGLGAGSPGSDQVPGVQPGGGGGYGVVCQSQIVQTQCYVVNEKDKMLVRSPESDEKHETASEKVIDEEAEGEVKGQLGSLQFAVSYDQEKSTLTVSVINAKNLPIKNATIGSSDPYVKLQLLPDKRQKVKTRVLRKTLNPVFDETFTFYGIDENQLAGITLHFAVLSFDRFSRDDVIGEVVYQLDEGELDTSKKAAITVDRQIIPRQIMMSGYNRGELLVSICHHPAASRLTVVILKARNLPKMDITGLADPYVKIYLMYNGQRIAKKKTHIKKRTLNPVYNESFIFDLPTPDPTFSPVTNFLAGVSLEMVVLDWDQMTKNEVIGRLEIGAGSRDAEGRHWTEVISCPRKQIASWHRLKQ